MAKPNRVCIICKKNYTYCNSCREDAGKPSWYAIFDGQNCYDIYEICTAYRDGIIDKKIAYDRISKCDISGLEDFAETTKAQIKEILGAKVTKEETKEEIKEKETVKTEKVVKPNVFTKNK